MLFKKRSADCIPVCSSAPSNQDISSSRAFSEGEQVSVRPDAIGRHERLRAVVLSSDGDNLRVRAEHSYYLRTGGLPIRSGAELDVHRSEVFFVNILD